MSRVFNFTSKCVQQNKQQELRGLKDLYYCSSNFILCAINIKYLYTFAEMQHNILQKKNDINFHLMSKYYQYLLNKLNFFNSDTLVLLVSIWQFQYQFGSCSIALVSMYSFGINLVLLLVTHWCFWYQFGSFSINFIFLISIWYIQYKFNTFGINLVLLVLIWYTFSITLIFLVPNFVVLVCL